MERLVSMSTTLAIWFSVHTGGPMVCTREMALFCLRESSILSLRLKHVLQGLKYHREQGHGVYWRVVDTPALLELAAHTRIFGYSAIPLIKERPLCVLSEFVNEQPGDVLHKAIKAAKAPGAMVVWGEEGEPHTWKVVG